MERNKKAEVVHQSICFRWRNRLWIIEQTPFSPMWYSHKFKAPGLRYEVSVSISTGQIVWANGPYPCGGYPDINIFNDDLVKHLDENERLLFDKGYIGLRCVHNLGQQYNSLSGTLLVRHETVNRRLKHFNVLGSRLRHVIELHSICFHSVLNLTELMLEHSDPLF